LGIGNQAEEISKMSTLFRILFLIFGSLLLVSTGMNMLFIAILMFSYTIFICQAAEISK